jgi:hypothetical protein
VELDWSALQQEAKTAGVIPAGEYNAIVTEASATQSSTGKPMIKIKARVMDGPQQNKPIWSQFTISPESPMALRMYFMQMGAFGLDSEYFGLQPSLADVASNLVNRAAVVTLSVRQWNGADRNQLDGVKPLPAGLPVPPGVVTGRPTVNAQVGATPMNAATPTTPTAPTSSAPAPTTPVVPSTPTSGASAPPAQPF